jgi:hypothetical protein
LFAQQVKFIDLTTTTQRVKLRYPPAPPVENGFGAYGGASVADYATDSRVKDAMIVWLLPVAALAQSGFDGIWIA